MINPTWSGLSGFTPLKAALGAKTDFRRVTGMFFYARVQKQSHTLDAKKKKNDPFVLKMFCLL